MTTVGFLISLVLLTFSTSPCFCQRQRHRNNNNNFTLSRSPTIALPVPTSSTPYFRLQRFNLSSTVVHRFLWREQTTSCSVTCGLGVAGVNYRCYSALTGKFVPETKCDPKRKPLTVRRTCKLADCEPRWEVGLWENCSANCGLGVVQRRVICVRYGTALPPSLPSFEEVADYFCTRNGQARPPDEKPCHNQKCSHWRVTPWSKCSSSCGSGIQTRKARCLRKLPERLPCDPLLRPQTQRPCNNADIAGDEGCLVSNKVSMEARGGSYAQQRPELVIKMQSHDMRPRYHVSEWGQCSQTCGDKPGIRYRVVQCRRYFPELRLYADVPNSECNNQAKPPHTEACKPQYVPCNKVKDERGDDSNHYQAFEWMETGFSTCSTTCGGGYRKNLVLCFGITETNQQVPVEDYRCANITRPIEKYETCGTDTCQPEWKITQKSECSVTCGLGVKYQSSRCIRRQPEIGFDEDLPEFMCLSFDRPPLAAACNAGPCSPQWKASPWSECSEACGVGWQVRNVSCILPVRAGYYEQVADVVCEDLPQQQHHHKPVAARRCVTLAKCGSIDNLVDTSTHVYLGANVEITHFLGGYIHALPSAGSSLTLICPAPVNATVEWFKDGKPVTPQSHRPSIVTTSLYHVKPIAITTTGSYSCSFRDNNDDNASRTHRFTSQVIIAVDDETAKVHFGIGSTTHFNWQRVDSLIFDHANETLHNKFNFLTTAAWNKKLEASIYVSDKCHSQNDTNCLKIGDGCTIGCALRRNNDADPWSNPPDASFSSTSSTGAGISFLHLNICFDLEKVYSTNKKTAKYPLLQAPLSSACKSQLTPGWTMQKTGSCDTQRCLSNFDIAVVDLTVRCQPLNRPDLDKVFLDENYCPLNERPLDYTFCLAPDCSKKRR